MSGNPILSYQQAAARGATPIGQIVALYDTILRDFLRALAALQSGDIEARVLELNHALLVVAHLQNVLNHEKGKDAAQHLDQFYSVTRGMIVEANIQATPQVLEKLIDLYGGLRQAWYQAEQKLAGDEPQVLSRDTEPSHPAGGAIEEAASYGDRETHSIRWSA